ncbi:MAG: prephenate dehydratase [Rhodospirillaceae bacterium]|nr:prephenate dehydratase [Rhodospirillaceae bacterium]MDE0616613.1 prephenate dehydratase [Rhodospirillaceae bacterium]
MIETAANRIAFQGTLGANSHIACRQVYPDMQPLPCATFEDSFAAVREGGARLAMIPIDNSVAGRVADIHHLLPHSGLYIIGEHFQRVEHCLLGTADAEIGGLKEIHSHIHALDQCRNLIAELGVEPAIHFDTAGAARDVAQWGDRAKCAIASSLAAEIYGLKILRDQIEDADHNTTRFIIMGPEHLTPAAGSRKTITSFVFRVRSVPAALYKALGGFATNNINITKLESYIIDGAFTVAQFYADVEGHPDEQAMKWAFEELDFFTTEWTLLGTYPASPFRG